MSRLVSQPYKDQMNRPGTTLAEIKVMRAEGRLPDGPRMPAAKVFRYATKAIDGVEEMDQKAVTGINDTLGNED